MAIKNLKWDPPLLHDLYDTYIRSVVHNQKSPAPMAQRFDA